MNDFAWFALGWLSSMFGSIVGWWVNRARNGLRPKPPPCNAPLRIDNATYKCVLPMGHTRPLQHAACYQDIIRQCYTPPF